MAYKIDNKEESEDLRLIKKNLMLCTNDCTNNNCYFPCWLFPSLFFL